MIAIFKKKSIIGAIVAIVFVVFIGVFALTSGTKKDSSIDAMKKQGNVTSVKKENNTTKDANTNNATNSSAVTNTSNTSTTNAAITTNTTQNKSSSTVATKISNTNENQQQQKTDSKRQTAVSNQTKQANTTTNTNTNSNTTTASAQHYVSTNLGFSITFPASWKGKYTVQENGSGITVCFKPKQKVNATGLLFKIVKRGPDVNEDVLDSVGGPRYFTAKGVKYVIGGPTDVNFPEDNPEFNTFEHMTKQCAGVTSTLKNIN